MMNDRFILMDTSGVEVSQCVRCRHFRPDGLCEAFPEGVPDEILANEHDHRQPYDGDNGVQFEPR